MLALKIENETTLPDGGPLSITVEGTRGIDIGRDQYLDWTLPDPSRFISGKHCEVRWRDGAYWLHDVSTNGTFLDGMDSRLKGPHKLADGDRFSIGHYVIVATVSGAAPAAVADMPGQAPPDYDNLWAPAGDVAPPIDPRQLKASRDLQPVKPDFLDWAVDLAPGRPEAATPHAGPSPWNRAPADDAGWAQGAPQANAPAQPPAAAAVPSPRRPIWVTGEPNGPWAAPRPVATENQDRGDDSFSSPLPAPGGDGGGDFLRLIARGAGLPDDALAAQNPSQFAEEVGQMLRLVAENMRQLLEARQAAKRLARSSSQTTVQALDNNPLKFAPTVEEAMRIMYGPPTKSYLDANRAIAQGFGDLKTHQIKTFSAMQHALKQLLQELDPATIEKTPGGRGIVGALGSSKARFWEIYTARWHARTHGHDDGMLDAFMRYFAECYDRDGNEV